MSFDNPHTSEGGAVLAWLGVVLGTVTAQDAAYVLASMVSVGALLINFDRYIAAVKRMIAKIKER